MRNITKEERKDYPNKRLDKINKIGVKKGKSKREMNGLDDSREWKIDI